MQLLAQPVALGADAAAAEGTLDHRAQLVGVDGLLEQVVGAGAHGLHGGADVGDAGEDDDGRGVVALGQVGQHLEARALGHVQVQQDEVGTGGLGLGQGLATGPRLERPVARGAAQAHEAGADAFVVVGDQQESGHGRAGRAGRVEMGRVEGGAGNLRRTRVLPAAPPIEQGNVFRSRGRACLAIFLAASPPLPEPPRAALSDGCNRDPEGQILGTRDSARHLHPQRTGESTAGPHQHQHPSLNAQRHMANV